MTKQSFKPNIEEDLNRPHNVTLTEGQISTILYVMEGYLQGDDKLDDELIPFLVTIPLQKLAFYSALEKGYDIDKPRNLAKSVTVE